MDEIPVFVSFLFSAAMGLVAALSWTAHRHPEDDASPRDAPKPKPPKRFAFLIAIIAMIVWYAIVPWAHLFTTLGYLGAFFGYLLAWSFPSGMIIDRYGYVFERRRNPAAYRWHQIELVLSLLAIGIVMFVSAGGLG